MKEIPRNIFFGDMEYLSVEEREAVQALLQQFGSDGTKRLALREERNPETNEVEKILIVDQGKPEKILFYFDRKTYQPFYAKHKALHDATKRKQSH